MAEALVVLGATCIVAAVIGGGLKVAQVAEIPLIDSVPRQALLAVVGAALIGAGLLIDNGYSPPPPSPEPTERLTVPAERPLGTPTVTLTEGSGPPGTSLRVGGQGFASNEAVTIRFQNEQVAAVEADTDGAFGGVTVVVPPALPFDGSFEIVATGEVSGAAARALFAVPPAALEVSPAQGSAGAEVRVVGTGFAVGEDVVLEFHLDQLATAPANSEGEFAVSVRIPASWPFAGEWDIVATGQTSRRIASQPFDIV